MVNPQHGHVRPAPGAALGNFSKGLVIDPQESHRAGRFPGRCFYRGIFWAQPGKRKPVPAARLLDQGSIPQSLENARGHPAHIVADRQHKTRRQLA